MAHVLSFSTLSSNWFQSFWILILNIGPQHGEEDNYLHWYILCSGFPNKFGIILTTSARCQLDLQVYRLKWRSGLVPSHPHAGSSSGATPPSMFCHFPLISSFELQYSVQKRITWLCGHTPPKGELTSAEQGMAHSQRIYMLISHSKHGMSEVLLSHHLPPTQICPSTVIWRTRLISNFWYHYPISYVSFSQPQ